jgi:hypothetical protein
MRVARNARPCRSSGRKPLKTPAGTACLRIIAPFSRKTSFPMNPWPDPALSDDPA